MHGQIAFAGRCAICVLVLVSRGFAASPGYAKAVLADKPIAFYRLNEGHLSEIANDSSVHGRHGEYARQGVTFLDTVMGNDAAVRFSGGVLQVPNEAALNPSNVTLEAIINWRGGTGALQCIFDKPASVLQKNVYRLCVQDDGKVRLELGANQNLLLQSASKLITQVPVHIVATYDAAGAKIYLNGKLDASQNQAAGPLDSTSTRPLGIGNRISRGPGFAGIIDEAAIYDRALTPARVRLHTAAAEIGPPEQFAPLTCFQLDDVDLQTGSSIQMSGSYTISGCRRSLQQLSRVRVQLRADDAVYTVQPGGLRELASGWWQHHFMNGSVDWTFRIHPVDGLWQLNSNATSGISAPSLAFQLELDEDSGSERVTAKATQIPGRWLYKSPKKSCGGIPAMDAVSSTPLVVHPPPETLTRGLSFPVQFGVPFAKGELHSRRQARVRDSQGNLVASQTKALGWWKGPGAAEGIKWLEMSFDASVHAKEYTLEYGACALYGIESSPLKVTSSARAITVDTGPLRFQINRSSPALIASASLDQNGDGQFSGKETVVTDSGKGRLYLTDQNGVEHRSGSGTIEIEDLGSNHVTLKATGTYLSGQAKAPADWIVRMKAYAGKPYIRVYHTFVVRESSATRQFKDIGMEIPLAADSNRQIIFAGGTEPTVASELPEKVHSAKKSNHLYDAPPKGSLMLHQRNHKNYTLYHSGAVPESVEKRSGHWFGAFGDRFGAAVAVRWFWQNYPGALEWTDTGALRVHFYTMRGQSALDFRPEQYLRSRGPVPAPNGPGLWDLFCNDIATASNKSEIPPECPSQGTMHATGVGVAKTHELLLTFAKEDSSGSMAEQSYLLQKPVIVQASPLRLKHTEALGRIHPYGQGFRGFESAISKYVDKFLVEQSNESGITTAAYGDSYGLLDFGDVLHAGKSAHRYWSHMFYLQPSVWWTLFARSGDRRFLEFGEANARHHMDVDVSHVTGNYGGTQIPAGSFALDDTGRIHWANHQTLPSSASMMTHVIPYLSSYYYQTGYERARDVALEIGGMIRTHAEKPAVWRGRSSGTLLWVAAELYNLTWHSDFKVLADEVKQLVVKEVREVCIGAGSGLCAATFQANIGNVNDPAAVNLPSYPDNSPKAPADFSLAYIFPGAIAYHQQTGDAAIEQWIVAQAQYIARARDSDNLGTTFTNWSGLAYAYHLSKKPELLREARFAFDEIVKHEERDISMFVGSRVWWMFAAPYLMDAVAEAGKIDPRAVAALAPAESTAGRILLKSEGAPFQVEARMRRIDLDDDSKVGSPAAATKASLVLIDPKGMKIATRPFPSDKTETWYFQGGWIERFEINSAVPGIYTLVMEQPDKPVYQIYLTHNSLGKAMFEAGLDDGISPGYRYSRGKEYVFHVPTGSREFTFTFTDPDPVYCDAFEFKLTDPSGSVLATRAFEDPRACKLSLNANGKLEYAIPAPAPGFWKVSLGATYAYATPDPGKGLLDVHREVRIFKVTGLPNRSNAPDGIGAFFGESIQSAFDPAQP